MFRPAWWDSSLLRSYWHLTMHSSSSQGCCALDMNRPIRAAAAQIAPVYMDKDKTIDRVCEVVDEVAARGTDLVVFPESMVPGYPYWRSIQPTSRWVEAMVEYQRNAVRVGSEDTQRIGEAVEKSGVNAVVGCTEFSDRPGSATLYNTMLFFDREGSLVGRHRKLMPTHAERMVWGAGDPADLNVFELDVGTVGGLVCFEHHVTLFKAALAYLGEEIHCAMWPGWFHQEQHPGIKRRWRNGDPLDSCDILYAVREYAFETQTFVVSASQFVADHDLPDWAQGFNIAAGGSMIVNATGLYLAEPVLGREEILYADLDPADRMAMKAYFDAIGHYARWDAVSLRLSRRKWEPIEPAPTELRRASEQYEVEPDRITAVLEATRGTDRTNADEPLERNSL